MVRQMVGDDVPLAWCGGAPGGGLGTNVEAILAAIDQAWSEAGVAILVDLGGAETNSEMAVEMLPEERRDACRDLRRAGGRGCGHGRHRSLRRFHARPGAPHGGRIARTLRDATTMTHSATGSVRIEHEVGLHARPSVKLTQLAKTLRLEDRVRRVAGRPVGRCQEHRQGHGLEDAQGYGAALPRSRRGRPGSGAGAGRAGRAGFRADTVRQMLRLVGTPASPGLACGPIFRLDAVERKARRSAPPDAEREAIAAAIAIGASGADGAVRSMSPTRRPPPSSPSSSRCSRTRRSRVPPLPASMPASRPTAPGVR